MATLSIFDQQQITKTKHGCDVEFLNKKSHFSAINKEEKINTNRKMYLGANLRIRKLGLCVIGGLLILVYLYSVRTSTNTISMKTLLAGAIKAAEIGGLEIIDVHNNRRLNIESKGKTNEGKFLSLLIMYL